MVLINNCKICGSDTESFYSDALDVTYHHCNNCEFIFKNRNELLNEKEELDRYLLHENSIEDEGYLNFFRKFLDKAVFKHDLIGSKALDFGSGPEPVLKHLLETEYNMEVDIYDLYFSPKKIYQNKEYDLIVSTEVVEHLIDPLKYFRLFKKHLKDGVHLAIMTLFHNNNKDRFLNWQYIHDPSHISFFSSTTMKYIAQTIELELTYVDDYRYTVFEKGTIR